jgi:hypothetical protein
MSQGFKLRFDQMRESDPTAPDTGSADAMPGLARNLCVGWPDGRRAFFNYAYLVAGEFRPDGEQNLIRLEFSGYAVSLHGYRLEGLFAALLEHRPRLILAADARYAALEEGADATVVSILVERSG